MMTKCPLGLSLPKAILPMLLAAILTLLPHSAFPNTLSADSVPSRHSLGAGAGAAWSFPANVDGASTKGSMAWRAHLSYDFWLNTHWAIGSGIAISTWSMKTHNSSFFVESNAVDKDGEAYEHHTSLSGIEERQSVTSADLPLRVSCRAFTSRRCAIFANAYVAAAFNFSAKYEVDGGRISTEGFYEKYNLTLYDMPINGFYSVNALADGPLNVHKVSPAAGGEVGALLTLPRSASLALSAFVRGSLTDIRKGCYAPQYDPDCLSADGYSNARYNSVLHTSSCQAVRPLIAGAGFSLCLPVGRRKKKGRNPLPSHPRAAAKTTPFETVPPVESAESVSPELELPVFADTLYSVVRLDSVPRVVVDDLQTRINEAGQLAFPLGGSSLSPEIEAVVDRIAELLVDNEDYNVYVIGHTCNKGTDPVNYRVGLARAKMVADALRKRGVESSRISISSAGSHSPIASNDFEQGRKKNRRAEVVVSHAPHDDY